MSGFIHLTVLLSALVLRVPESPDLNLKRGRSSMEIVIEASIASVASESIRLHRLQKLSTSESRHPDFDCCDRIEIEIDRLLFLETLG